MVSTGGTRRVLPGPGLADIKLADIHMRPDTDIQKDVMRQLQGNPLLTASEIGVAVRNGVVTLSGLVDTSQRKMEAEKEAWKVWGVKGLAEDIQMGLSPLHQRSDTELAQAVLNALHWHDVIPEEKIKIKVADGIVTLEGEVDREYQRESVLMTVSYLGSVRKVINLLTLKQKEDPER
jgi:osmotically-inducible protein OsmY